MSQKNPCDVCGSSDNLVTYDNGSIWCHTPNCKSNTTRKRPETPEDNGLILGSFSPLLERRISQRTCEFFNYTWGVHNGIKVQIANYVGGCQQVRTSDKKFYFVGDTSKLTLWGKQKWNNTANTIVITEGQIDAMSIAEAQDCKWPVVSLPNGAGSARKAIQAELDWLLGFKNIILCFDNDEAGKVAVESCVDLFPPGRLKVASLSEKDANECLKKGKFEELNKIVFNAQEYRPDGVIAVKDIDINKLFKPKPRGYSLPYAQWDDASRGLPRGRITTMYAKTGIGKTTIFKEVVIHLCTKYPNLKIGGIFLEESKDNTLEYLLAMQNNVATWKVSETPSLLTMEQKQNAFNNLKNLELYDHFGSTDPNRLLNLIEYWAVGKGVEVIILDHITMVFSGLDSSRDGQTKDIDAFMTRLRSLVERTGIHLLTATQLKRRNRDKDSSGTELISDDDARGSGAIEQISDYLLFLNRNKRGDRPNEIELELYKNRYTGIEGTMDTLEFNKETGRELVKNVATTEEELF